MQVLGSHQPQTSYSITYKYVKRHFGKIGYTSENYRPAVKGVNACALSTSYYSFIDLHQKVLLPYAHHDHTYRTCFARVF